MLHVQVKLYLELSNKETEDMTLTTKTADTVSDGIGNMIETMKDDFIAWDGDADGWQAREYCDGFKVMTGKKYARVINRDCVAAFVVLVDNDKKFRKGDILKPAGYATPARNSARGNVLDGGYKIKWTGTLYLR